MNLQIDRELPVPLGVQVRGMIEYGISCGELATGERLPSVRELADALNVAPMTVAQVYRDLRDSGLIHTRQGLGTVVAAHPGSWSGSPAARGRERSAAWRHRGVSR